MQKTIQLDGFPHLAGALAFNAKTGANTCVQRSAALMLDMPGATLVFGIVRAATPEERAQIGPQASPVPFIHAWVEYKGMLYAPTLVERFGKLHPFPVDTYYSSNGVTKTWKLPHKAFMLIARRYRLSSAFKHRSARAGDGVVADALLNAAGVKYVLSERRTLLPAP